MSVIRVRNPSLEFNWLPNSIRKGLPTPRIVIVNRSDCGGFYCAQTKNRCIHPWVDMDVSEGPVIGVANNDNETAGIIAHEYRHHWQWLNHSGLMGRSVWSEPESLDYKASIIRYFRSFWWEMDALRFQLKHAPDDLSCLWWDWLMEARQKCA